MPAGDGTGPLGLGPMTGRAAGYCAGYPVPGYMNPIPGRFWPGRFYRGLGFFGRGRGWRYWYYATGLPGWYRAAYGVPAYGWGWYPPYAPYPYSRQFGWAMNPEEEIKMLQEEQEFLKSQLDELQKYMETLEKAKEQEKKKEG